MRNTQEMKEKLRKEILNHYNQLYEKFGINSASIGWPKGRQKIRFQIATELGDFEKSKILDVGCGFGDFAAFLKTTTKKFSYHGVDINAEFIKIAKKKHPDHKFSVRDIEEKKFNNKFDWVCAIGTTNSGGSYEYIKNLMNEMLRISKKGIMMDFMSSYVDYKNKGDFHVSPEQVFKIAKRFSKRVVIRHDYLPFEFCVYVYKNEILKKNHTFVVSY